MTPTPQPKALELAEHLECFRSFPKDQEAAAELRRQHAEIEALRIDSIACRAAIEHAIQLVEDFASSPEGDDDMSQGAARATRRQLNEAIGKMSPRLMYERDGPKPMYSLHYKELRDERDSLRAEVEREREARKAAQIRQAELIEEVVRLEPMRQRAADIERLTAEVEEWRKLKDPAVLHANLIRGLPADLTPEQRAHIAAGQMADQEATILALRAEVENLRRKLDDK